MWIIVFILLVLFIVRFIRNEVLESKFQSIEIGDEILVLYEDDNGILFDETETVINVIKNDNNENITIVTKNNTFDYLDFISRKFTLYDEG